MPFVPPLAPAIYASSLRCESRSNPLGIDVVRPRLSWIDESPGRGARQTAYRIIVATRRSLAMAGRADLWDSRKVLSSQTLGIRYSGKPLESARRVWWSVQVWNAAGRPSGYSPPAYWEMGLLHRADWKASWISFPAIASTNPGPSPYLRRGFRLESPVVSARLYASALGLYRVSINGSRVGNDFFTPGWTDYHKRVQYQTYDVTSLLRPGANAIGVVLGDGWYCGRVGWQGRQHYGPLPRALVQLEARCKDGSTVTLCSDLHWKASTGPILMSDLLLGETFDARREIHGWCSPGLNESGWSAVDVQPIGSVPLVAQCDPPVRAMLELHPVRITARPGGVFICDLGQNMVGFARLRVRGKPGQQITLRYAEMLNPDGSIYTRNLRSARATDEYTLRGVGEETYQPSFTFHGFRYIEVTGYPGRPSRRDITGVVVHSATPLTGHFECSSPLVNQLQHNITWGQIGNFLEVPTDCPQRDERLGWMGDAEIFSRTACFNMDVDSFYTKWMHDVVDAQSPEGGFSDVSPRLVDLSDGAPAWGDAGVIVPWSVYQAYGDTGIIRSSYDAMERWIAYVSDANPDHLWTRRVNNNFGDWLGIGADTPREVMSTAYFARSTYLLSGMARAIGRDADAARYEALFRQIKDAFNRAFVAADGAIKGDTQTCYVLALRFGLLPSSLRAAAGNRLAENIKQHGWHLSTGFVGVGNLLPALTDTGHMDVAYHLLNNDTFPSWGYSIKQGATTIWERWDGWTREKGFQDPGMNSFNHYSLGSVGEWMYDTAAGIDLDEQQPGYSHILLHPRPGGGLTYVRASLESPHGLIRSEWKIKGNRFLYHIVVPANTTATVTVPTSGGPVTEAGLPPAESRGVRLIARSPDSAVFQVQSGSYDFAAPRRP